MSDKVIFQVSAEKRKRNTLTATLTGTRSGLGLVIVGGRNVHYSDDYSGIFIKELVHGGLAARHGQLKVGDQLLQANMESLIGVSNEKAVEVLKMCAATGDISFLIARDKRSLDEFHRLSQKFAKQELDQGVMAMISTSQLSSISDTTQGSNDFLNAEAEYEEISVPPPLPTSFPPNERSIPRVNAGTGARHIQESKLSVNPNNKYRLDKLLSVVDYIGIKLTPQQLEKLHDKLDIDSRGKVVFIEFTEALQQIIPNKFDTSKFLEVFTNPDESYSDTLQADMKYLKDTNVKLKGENDRLRNVIQMLQNKNDQLEQQIRTEDQTVPTEREVMKTLAAKDCELKKLEASNRRYQVAVDILVKFVEDCHEALVKSEQKDSVTYYPRGTGLSVIRGDQITGNSRPPQYLSKHVKKTNASLANDGKDAIAEVKRILNDAAVLPYGWEEEYTEDGRKYYVNHEKQSTSWVHPVTRQPPPQ